MSATTDRVRDVVEPVVVTAGFDLEELTVRAAGRRSQVIVVVDADAFDVDGLAEVSRAVSAALDDSDAMGETPYTLEVTSRGVGRPLTLPRHWRRNVGRLVAVELVDGDTVSGRISGAGEDEAHVGDVVVAYSDVARAVVQIDFSATGEA